MGQKVILDSISFGANGTPSTQAHGDSAAVGTSLDAARSDHKHAMPAAGAGGAVTRVGSNTTEATTTSTTIVDLTTLGSLSLGDATNIFATVLFRKTTGAANSVRCGWALNNTALADATCSSTSNANESGYATMRAMNNVSNYPNGGHQTAHNISGSGNFFKGLDIAIPSASITDVDFQGLVNNASITMGADEMHVYTYAVS